MTEIISISQIKLDTYSRKKIMFFYVSHISALVDYLLALIPLLLYSKLS